jgi:hypothetical protein
MRYSLELFEEVRVCLSQPNRPENQERLAIVAKSVSSALRECLSCLPGQQVCQLKKKQLWYNLLRISTLQLHQ